jgi:hypothetical protein
MILASAAAMTLAGCGSSKHHAQGPVAVTHPAHPVWCPTSHVSTGPAPNGRAAGSFDARGLLGLTETDAARRAAAHGCEWRTVTVDGKHQTITADERPNRVDGTVTDGIVTNVAVY